MKKEKTKKCSKCGEEKSVSEFYKRTSSSDGLDSYCRMCRKSQRKINAPCADKKTKICNKCDNEKSIKEFGLCSANLDGFMSFCKKCANSKTQKLRQKNKDKNKNKDHYNRAETKVCSKCKIEKSVKNFNKGNSNSDGLSSSCKSCCKEYYKKNKKVLIEKSKAYYVKNKDSVLKRSKKHYVKNSKKIIDKNKKYYQENRVVVSIRNKKYRLENKDKVALCKKKYMDDPVRKLWYYVRRGLRRVIKSGNKTEIMEKYLGCSVEQLRKHIEDHFDDNMTWENYGLFGWHIDHIIPVSTIKDENDLEQIKKVCHYTNLQPLWAEDNLSKGAKLNWEK